MHPSVRAAVATLADRAKMFDLDSDGNNNPPSAGFSFPLRAFFVAGKQLDSQDMDKFHTLFNVDESFLEFEKPKLFSKMKNLRVLCLGRWRTSPNYHIEVEDTKFLEGLKNMKYLKFLSLQGISRITQLPVNSISKLANLTILDLRACHNLEEIPDKIGSLKSLTHLDMSECYLLDHMPKELSSLSQLQVLKGFIVGKLKGKNSCTLEDLANLPKLRKLSIYAGRKDFPAEAELRDLHKFKELRKLKITWGVGSQDESRNHDKQKKVAGKSAAADATEPENRSRDSSDYVLPELPTQLEKLDLYCFPQIYAPGWLKPSKLKMIKKLYIRGGVLCDLGQFEEEEYSWEVEILRLKFLGGMQNELEIDWKKFRKLFPNLIYLEKVECPKLTLFPCDARGVWWVRKQTNRSNFD